MAAMSIAASKQTTAPSADRLDLLRNHSLFGQLPAAAVEHLGSYMKRRTLPRGSQIFAKGEPGTGLMGVLTGTVKISVPSVDGRDIVLNMIHEGEIFGEIALLDGRPRTADATAMTDCELMVIERRDFIPFLRSQPDLTIKIIEILCERLRRTSEQVQEVTFLNLPTRLAKALLRLSADVDARAATRRVTITQREISQIIGRSRESTNKQLRTWEKDGWISLERGALTVLRRDKVAEVAAQDSELDRS
jgi:CRP-like cAMP-binding protein